MTTPADIARRTDWRTRLHARLDALYASRGFRQWTADELDALPLGSVLAGTEHGSAEVFAAVHQDAGWWDVTGEDAAYTTAELAAAGHFRLLLTGAEQ